MEFSFQNKKIILNKTLSELDNFVIRFTKLLDHFNVKYVIVSGYVSIIFGRSRHTEDIDLLIEHLSFEQFEQLWKNVLIKFECINTDDPKEAYHNFLTENVAIRFSEKGIFIPNIEFKFVKTDLDKWTLDNRIELALSNSTLFISPIELQIAFKLFLGSEKDFEDAKHIYNIFKDHLNKKLFGEFLLKLRVEKIAKQVLS
ncbi:MAG: hypothetical protein V1870_03410 [Candidatus Aenigmatarchaeota archaeon]